MGNGTSTWLNLIRPSDKMQIFALTSSRTGVPKEVAGEYSAEQRNAVWPVPGKVSSLNNAGLLPLKYEDTHVLSFAYWRHPSATCLNRRAQPGQVRGQRQAVPAQPSTLKEFLTRREGRNAPAQDAFSADIRKTVQFRRQNRKTRPLSVMGTACRL